MSAQNNNVTMLAAYLIVGEDELKRQTVIKRLRQRVSSIGDLEFNHDLFNGEEALGSDIVAACNTLPFASELRLVEVANVEALKKADQDALVEYLQNPCETTTLALIGLKLAKNTKLYKTVAALNPKAIIDCAPMKHAELQNAVRSMAVSHGFTISAGAAAKLIDLVGEDTVTLNSQLEKLALAHTGNAALTETDVVKLVERTAEAKPWQFVDAFSARNVAACIALRAKLQSTSSYALLAMCTTRVRELICARALTERGEARRIAEELKQPSWRVKNHAHWAKGFGAGELERALGRARDTEQAMKSGSDPESAFMEWVVTTIARK